MIAALRDRLGAWRRGSAHAQVLSAAAVVALFSFLAKLASAGKDILVAQRFGTSSDVDAFLLAFLLPSFAITVLGSTIKGALLPTYVEVREQEGIEAAGRLLASATLLGLLLLLATAALLAAAVPALLPLVGRSLAPATLRLTADLTLLLVPCVVVTAATMTWTAVLNAQGRFAVAAAAALAVPLAAIAALLALGPAHGVRALVGGTVAGFVLEAAVVGAALRRAGTGILPRWHGLSPALRRVVGQYLPMAAGMLVMATNGPVDQIMAARLSPGSVAALGYGVKLESFAMGIGVVSIGTAVLPHFSQLAARKDWAGLDATIRRYAWLLAALAVPPTAAAVLLAEPIVRLLFERGAFGPQDTVLVARIQTFYLLALPVKVVGLLFVRFIMAVKANRVLMWISVSTAVINVAGNWVLSIFLGVAGIALSTSVVYLASVGMSFAYTRRRLRQLRAGAPPPEAR